MEYKRLKEKLETMLTLPDLPFEEDLTAIECKQMYDILCKIEQGTLIELPCKVGDTVYVIEYYEIKEYLVTTICIDENNEVFLELEKNHNLMYQYPYNVWFTKAEAEKRLKELQE